MTGHNGTVVKYLIWDFDGTLAFNRRGMWSGTMLHLLREAAPDLRVSSEDLRPYLQTGFPWHEPKKSHPELDTPQRWWDALHPVLERAYLAVGVSPRLSRELTLRVREDFVDPQQWRIYDDVFPALDDLSRSGWAHLVLSNHVPELSRIVHGLGLGGRISRIFSSAETGHEKPHPEAYRAVLGTLADPESVWMVGDNVRADVLGAEEAGIPAVLVRRPHPDAARYSEDLLGARDFIEVGS